MTPRRDAEHRRTAAIELRTSGTAFPCPQGPAVGPAEGELLALVAAGGNF